MTNIGFAVKMREKRPSKQWISHSNQPKRGELATRLTFNNNTICLSSEHTKHDQLLGRLAMLHSEARNRNEVLFELDLNQVLYSMHLGC